MARDFYSTIKSKHGTNAFNCLPYKENRYAIRECTDKGILDNYPVLYNKNNLPIFSKQFTIIVMKDKVLSLRYN